jgi:hypothetical protein
MYKNSRKAAMILFASKDIYGQETRSRKTPGLKRVSQVKYL